MSQYVWYELIINPVSCSFMMKVAWRDHLHAYITLTITSENLRTDNEKETAESHILIVSYRHCTLLPRLRGYSGIKISQ